MRAPLLSVCHQVHRDVQAANRHQDTHSIQIQHILQVSLRSQINLELLPTATRMGSIPLRFRLRRHSKGKGYRQNITTRTTSMGPMMVDSAQTRNRIYQSALRS